MRPLVWALFGVVLSGCIAMDDIDEVPAHPLYTADVLPLLADHCLVCHNDRPRHHAPDTFRLDVYDDVDGKSGARRMADQLVHMVEIDEMPPAAGWGQGVGPNGKELLERWLADGAPR